MIESKFLILIDPDEFRRDGTRKNLGVPAEVYVQDTRKLIEKIANTQTGGVVLHSLSLWKSIVRISPFEDSPFSTDSCGIGGGATTSEPELKDFLWNKNRHLFNFMLGANLPVSCTVRFTTNRYLSGGGCHTKFSFKTVADYTPTPEEVLLHELVHALRYKSKTLSANAPLHKGTNLENFHGEEEFIAVVVQNIFQSEVKGNIRASHSSFRHLDASLQDSFEFYRISQKCFGAMQNFVTSNPHFTGRLSKLKVPFNPVAAFFQDQNKCRELSRSISARIRDDWSAIL